MDVQEHIVPRLCDEVEEALESFSEEKIISLIPGLKEKLEKKEAKDLGCVKDNKIVRNVIWYDDPIWVVIDPLLGRTTDQCIAEFFQITVDNIARRREVLLIRPFQHVDWDVVDPLFKYGTDEEIEALLNPKHNKVSYVNIASRRGLKESEENVILDLSEDIDDQLSKKD